MGNIPAALHICKCSCYFPCDPLKIHPSATYAMLLPFSVLNYDPAQADELYDVCIQHIIPHISKLIREHFPLVNPASH